VQQQQGTVEVNW